MPNTTRRVGVSASGNSFEVVIEIEGNVKRPKITFIIATNNQSDLEWWERFFRKADSDVVASLGLPISPTGETRNIDGVPIPVYRPVALLTEELERIAAK